VIESCNGLEIFDLLSLSSFFGDLFIQSIKVYLSFILSLKPSNHQIKTSSKHQNIKTSKHQNIKTSKHQNIRTSKHQIIKS